MEQWAYLFSVDNVVLSILDYDLSLIELVATILTVVNVILAAKRKIINWPIGIVAVTLMAVLFHQIQLYGDFTLQFFFIVTGIIGWVGWVRAKEGEEVPISRGSFKQNVFWAVIITIATVFAGIFYINCNVWLPAIFTEEPSFPVLDGFIAVASVCGQILMMKRRRETYVIWLIVDALATVLYFIKDVKLISLEYLFFTGVAVYGLIQWTKHSRASSTEKSGEREDYCPASDADVSEVAGEKAGIADEVSDVRS
jgi:nicotinamide mononucleotide transporter